MIPDLIYLFVISLLISVSTFGGGSEALFYQYGVLQTRWINETDFSAVMAFGYATPGPAVFGTATFIGYRIGGLGGAIIGTIGIFIVPFLTSFLAAKYFRHILTHSLAHYFIQGVGLAAAGLVAAPVFIIFDVSEAAVWQIVIAIIALIISLKTKVNPVYILLMGLVSGLILS